MWIALNWIVTGLGLAAWTALCLALQGVGRLLGGVDGRPSDWLQALERWQIPVWLADWLPLPAITALKSWLTEWVAQVSPWLDMGAGLWPAGLADWLAPLLWLLWAVGALMLLGAGAVGHVLVRALQGPRAVAPQVAAPGSPAA